MIQELELAVLPSAARYDSSSQGRFTTADSFSGSIGNPQSLNRYTYVGNNPINYSDPSGQTPSIHTMSSIRDGGDGPSCHGTGRYSF